MKRYKLWFTSLLPVLDLIGVLISIVIANSLRTTIDILPIGENRVSYTGYHFLAWYFPILVGFFIYNRLYIFSETRIRIQQMFRVASGTAAAAMVQLMVALVGRTPFVQLRYPSWNLWATSISLLTIFYLWVSAFVVITMMRFVYRALINTLFAEGIGTQRLLFVGITDVTKTLLQNIRYDPSLGLKIIGVVNTNGHHDDDLGVPILGNFADLETIVTNYHPDQIIEADPDLSHEKIMAIIDVANEHHIDFIFAPNLFEVLATNVEISTIGGIPLLELKRTPLDGWGKILKRWMDVVVCLILLIPFAVIYVIIGLLIKLQDGGPVLFAHKRISMGKPFDMYKFRSMVKDAEKLEDKLRKTANERDDGPLFKMKNDPRVTALGRFLRKSRLDEVPQILNVLRGDMSLIGPRPHILKEVEQYQKHHKKVLAIKPGMSGVAQLAGNSDLSFEEEVRLDTYYIEHWSLLKDLELLIKTPFIIVFKDRSGA